MSSFNAHWRSRFSAVYRHRREATVPGNDLLIDIPLDGTNGN